MAAGDCQHGARRQKTAKKHGETRAAVAGALATVALAPAKILC